MGGQAPGQQPQNRMYPNRFPVAGGGMFSGGQRPDVRYQPMPMPDPGRPYSGGAFNPIPSGDPRIDLLGGGGDVRAQPYGPSLPYTPGEPVGPPLGYPIAGGTMAGGGVVGGRPGAPGGRRRRSMFERENIVGGV